MKKVVIKSLGGIENLIIEDENISEPKKGEIQIRILTSAVSGADINMRLGSYPMQKTPPFTPGYSIIGEVIKLGEGSNKFKLNDRVSSLTMYDGQAEFINLPEKFVQSMPVNLDPKEAVCLILDGMTAYQMLYRYVIPKNGKRIFIHGVSGAVGSIIAKLGKMHGLEMFGTASPSKHNEVLNLGVTAFDYNNYDFVNKIIEMGGVDAVFDPLGFESFDRSNSMLRKGGVLVGYGLNNAVFHSQKANIIFAFLKFQLRKLIPNGKRAEFYGIDKSSSDFEKDQAQLFSLLAEKKIIPSIKAVFPLTEIRAAHEAWKSSSGIGSIVIEIGK
ncbi:MAG: medium chain dehydrogenase/reductase family protein [Leptospiraceae bacterium]|nr:medium chain dehydrogenase/reductase family protein [Leptospiraceae bacterium]